MVRTPTMWRAVVASTDNLLQRFTGTERSSSFVQTEPLPKALKQPQGSKRYVLVDDPLAKSSSFYQDPTQQRSISFVQRSKVQQEALQSIAMNKAHNAQDEKKTTIRMKAKPLPMTARETGT